MKAQFVNFFIVSGYNAIIGAYKIAHAAADAGMDRVSALVDTVINSKQVARFFRQPYGDVDGPLPVNTQLNCANWTDGSAPAAEGALFFIPQDNPRKIFYT
jgi:hypothetical protein